MDFWFNKKLLRQNIRGRLTSEWQVLFKPMYSNGWSCTFWIYTSMTLKFSVKFSCMLQSRPESVPLFRVILAPLWRVLAGGFPRLIHPNHCLNVSNSKISLDKVEISTQRDLLKAASEKSLELRNVGLAGSWV